MDVTRLIYWKSNSHSKPRDRILELARDCLVGRLNCVFDKEWLATMYASIWVLNPAVRAPPGEIPREMVGIALEENAPEMFFCSRNIAVKAQSSMLSIFDAFGSYKKKSFSFTIKGYQFKYHEDNQLRLGQCFCNYGGCRTTVGIVMEVSELYLSSIKLSHLMLEEFCDIWNEALAQDHVPGHFEHEQFDFAAYNLGDDYSSHHKFVQYYNCIKKMVPAAFE